MHRLASAAVIALLASQPALSAQATADVRNSEGDRLGAVFVRDTPSGVAIATVTLVSVPTGIHGIHLHETADCSAEDFSSAGGHLAGDRQHGVLSDDGPHPGDMPNLTVKSDGIGEVEVFLPNLDVGEDLLDEDGSAFVMHAGPDDYQSQPAGDAGDRIACGEFEERG